MPSHIYARNAFHLDMLANVLAHEGHQSFWYLCPDNGPTLVTDAPTESLMACVGTVNTALRLRGARAVRT